MLKRVIAGLIACCLYCGSATAASPMKLWRLDCGSFSVSSDAFSDTLAYSGQRRTLVGSCYLIRHGDQLLLWDAGLSADFIGRPLDQSQALSGTLSASLPSQMARIGLRPSDVTILGISHNHVDHIGQAGTFPQARLLIGREDFEALRHPPYPFAADAASLRYWLDGKGVADEVTGDRDVFGDGTVVMIALPGHTKGHHGLLVRLPKLGAVLIAGDTWHFADQIPIRGVPPFNESRAESVAAMDRALGLARNLHARMIIQHDPDDVKKLPPFPAFAE